jgi:radical SAM modification target selenobiotic family peptide
MYLADSCERSLLMGCDKLKSILAGIGLAGLMAGVALTSPGNTHGGTG